jgi:acrylyl-CoA reductase (NADPH)
MTFQALMLRQENKETRAAVESVDVAQLPAGEVLVDVAYSSLNYKDGLNITGAAKVARFFPMVAGIDGAGMVVESSSPRFSRGDHVVMTGCGSSETFWGGMAQKMRVSAEFLVPVPSGISLQQAMAIGTAGFTAMQSVMALEAHGLKPGGREVIVTGAAGGVGSISVTILARLGYQVVASTGRPELHDYLKSLGASRILDRAALATPSGRPLDSETWGGAVDSVGGETLASVVRQLARGASVAACGVAGGHAVNTMVYPFILRGANLLGIDSLAVPNPERLAIWERIRRDLPLDKLEAITQVVSLREALELARAILKGQVRGRVVVDVNA